MAREMKDSGIEWIGEIPIDWKAVQLKRFAFVHNGREISTEVDYSENAVPVYGSGGAFKYTDACMYDGTAVLFGRKGTLGKPLYAEGKIWAVDTMYFLTHTGDLAPRFNYYQLSVFNWEPFITHTAIPSIVASEITACQFAFPSIEEQTHIAAFLDRKCAEIDSVMADTQRTIEEYKRLKQSIITEAVTKGVRGKRLMKDSGIEYCDAIPSDWNITRMAFINWIRARLGWKGLKAEEYVDVGYPFLSAFNIINDKLVWCDLNHITQERYDESPEIKLSVGDILLVKDGAGIGKCGRIDELPLGEATVNSSLAVITPNENLYYKYEYYYFLCDAFQKVITVLRNGMGVPHLTQEIMKGIRIPLPPMEEQVEIAEYLDKKSAEIDRIISAKEMLLTELESYKKSVIYEYVTGKKEVPACL